MKRKYKYSLLEIADVRRLVRWGGLVEEWFDGERWVHSTEILRLQRDGFLRDISDSEAKEFLGKTTDSMKI